MKSQKKESSLSKIVGKNSLNADVFVEKKQLNILIVEDLPTDVDLLIRRLTNEGFIFEWKCVETEADYLLALKTAPDLIISDWVLPRFSGSRALQILREQGLDFPFIIFSGFIGEERAVEAVHQGAYDYIIKDRPERLSQAIHNALKQNFLNEQRKKDSGVQLFQTAALNAAANAIMLTDNQGIIEWVNPAYSILTGYTVDEALGKNPRDLVRSGVQSQEFYKQMWDTILSGKVWSGELTNHKKNGELYVVERTITPVQNQEGKIGHFVTIEQDITERKKSDEYIKKLSRVVEQTTEIVFITDLEGVIEYVNPAFVNLTGFSKEEVMGKTPRILKSDLVSLQNYEDLWATILAGHDLHDVVINRKKNGEIYYQDTTISPLRDGEGKITHFVSTGRDITERMRIEEESKNRLENLEAMNQISTSLRVAQTLDEMLPLLLDETLNVLHESMGDIRLYDPNKGELKIAVSRGYGEQSDRYTNQPEKTGEGIASHVLSTGEPYVSKEYHTDIHIPESVREQIPSGYGGVTVPICAGSNVIGTITISRESFREITASEVKILNTLSEVAGIAIQRTSLKQQIERQLQYLTSLREIDQVILSSVDLHLNLGTILKQVSSQLKVDAADILLYDPISKLLDFGLGRGFITKVIELTRLRLGESYAGNAAFERRIIHIPDLQVSDNQLFMPLLINEHFISYYAIPLIVKGQIKGVMELFHRSMLEPDDEWLSFLNSLAGQAAIAIDNSSLFDDLQRSNIELSLAYDATIEGWSRALDLRDEETEGHTLRVTEMTLKLASSFGINGEDLIQIRWGALLHDIGKMGVPDKILLKPGPLSDEEWVIMKKHPTYAYEMLSPIRYLRSAMDIPYCHHEKWDGTGYPRGLKGEQIPLSARIFAIIDVWDALRSDRPYREAWPAEKVLAHLQSLSGTHFDPAVLKICLDSGTME